MFCPQESERHQCNRAGVSVSTDFPLSTVHISSSPVSKLVGVSNVVLKTDGLPSSTYENEGNVSNRDPNQVKKPKEVRRYQLSRRMELCRVAIHTLELL